MANKAQSEKYIDLISQSSKDVETEQLQFRAQEASLQADSSILETKKAIATAKRELTELKRAIPYSFDKEISKTIEVKNLEEGLSIAESIQKSRFGA
ncbi:hypothetical protein Phi40:1_gp048 [Cellulophaga phage phi40:1]|jgi:ribosomal protein L29|uniref:Uncharacterized protein n=1 Tax=Cellulophaga phage phi38:1 TaxID=1327977 RepID=S0A1J8_9CAUD|nr:hypothetical protein Phi38:1_gp048 [Cellulophaga phage phi38:1]AGO47913.1 hypothetical protein Phi40:1_gp048 [Cellulophaga phage phi40:1]AGO48078.1 hypothetical protein Phi38:1_gp048 [Cellulophaga phage phi38:1]